MNLNQLKYVLSVAQEKNFSNAAQKLFISQPSLSESILSLEKELGTSLFERRPFKITHAGEIFIKWAQKMLYEEKQMKQKISDISESQNIKLIIGMSPYRSSYLLPRVISEFKKEYQNFNILLEEHPSDILQKMLDEEKVDLLIDTPNYDSFAYTSIPIIKEKILLGVPSDWDVKTYSKGPYPEIDLNDFKDKSFILLTKKQLIGQVAWNLCSQCGFVPDILLECHNIETAYSMISKGMGISFIPELFVKYINDSNNKMKCYTIKDFLPQREIAVIYNKGCYISKPLKKFIDILKNRIKE